MVSNGEVIKVTVAEIRKSKAPTGLKWVKGHAGNEVNEAADLLANEGSNKPTEDVIETEVPAALLVSGAKLQALTQSTAYRILRNRKMKKPRYAEALKRRKTLKNMDLAKGAATDENDTSPSASGIWRSTRHKDISRNIRFFLWMLIHDGYKVGSHWEHIPGFEDRVDCHVCGVPESMEHILTKCDAPGQSQIWELASELWRMKTDEDLKPYISQNRT